MSTCLPWNLPRPALEKRLVQRYPRLTKVEVDSGRYEDGTRRNIIEFAGDRETLIGYELLTPQMISNAETRDCRRHKVISSEWGDKGGAYEGEDGLWRAIWYIAEQSPDPDRAHSKKMQQHVSKFLKRAFARQPRQAKQLEDRAHG